MLKNRRMYILCLAALFTACAKSLCAQDRIYGTHGDTIFGKVVQIDLKQVIYKRADRPDGLTYVVYQYNLDSVVFANGTKVEMPGFLRKKKRSENIPQLNSVSFDPMAFMFLTVSFSYERRLKNGKVGFRIPLYYQFKGGGIAGVGQFMHGFGLYYMSDGENYYPFTHNNFKPSQTMSGNCFATGINPRVYLFKRRRTRAFIGPELTVGEAVSNNTYLTYTGNFANYGAAYVEHDFTFTALVKAGFMFHPSDWFHICIDGGAGEGGMFGKPNPLGWTGVWHFGVAFGANF